MYFFKKLKSTLSRDEVIKEVTDKEHFNIDYLSAVKAIANLDLVKCKRYDRNHYNAVFIMLKEKLNTFSNKEDMITYLNSLSLNYEFLSNNNIFDDIIQLLIGSFIGASFIDESNDSFYRTMAVIFVIVFFVFKIYVTTTRKWSFYNRIFEQLKNDIS